MSRKNAAFTFAAALGVFLLLFEVDLNPEFSLPAEIQELDPAQEARYEACYAERDREIHATAFGTIDNPDVQKLYIINNRAEARAACRREIPEAWITVETPLRFKLFDLRFRYWRGRGDPGAVQPKF